MSTILLSIVGNTPQVVTETLYAIHKGGKSWPSQIRVITTTVGKLGALRLIEENILRQLCEELDVPLPQFSEKDILVVPDANGEAVADARTIADHEALANFIVTELRDLTDETNPANHGRRIHASLAGGRKTMTFYLGYAMSLFGRPEDRLSHVLVSSEFENLPTFFYPSKLQNAITTRDGKEVNPADAVVELADIPFIRHRDSLPAVIKQPKGKSISFRELITWINLGEKSEPLRIVIDTANRQIQLHDVKTNLRITCQPGLLEFAFYQMMAKATLENNQDIVRPDAKNVGALYLAKIYCKEMLQIIGEPSADNLADALANIADWNELNAAIKNATLVSLESGMKRYWFDQRNTNLRDLFETFVPKSLCNRIMPTPIHVYEGDPSAQKGYGISSENVQIEII